VGEYASTGTLSATNVFGADGLISRRTAGASVFYNFDDRGNVAQTLDGNGNSFSVFQYDVWGNRTQPVGNTPGPWDMGARFGYYTDTETGLSLLTHRFYDPVVGRFLTRDPLGYGGGINLYGYVRNNPVNRVDPRGTQSIIGVEDCNCSAPDNGGSGFTFTGDDGPFGSGNYENEGYPGWDGPVIPPLPPDPPQMGRKPSRQSDKDKSTNVPSWSKYCEGKNDNETCQEWASRQLDDKYGKGNWKKGTGTEYSEMVKGCERGGYSWAK